MKRWIGVTSSAITGLVVAGVMALAAPPGVINAYNAICDAGFPTRCASVDATGALKTAGGGGGGSGMTATAADPTYVEGSPANPMSSDLSGYQRVLAKQGSTPWIVSGAVTAADQASMTGMEKTLALMSVYSAANGWTNLVREAAPSLNSDGKGLPEMNVTGMCDDTAPNVVTENQWGNRRMGCTDHSQLVGGLLNGAGGVATAFGLDGAGNLRVVLNASSNGTQTVTGAGSANDDAPVTSALKTYSQLGLYDPVGLNIDMAREAQNGLNSVGIGLPPAQLVGQCDDTSPVAITENQFGNARVNCTDHSLVVSGLGVNAGKEVSIIGTASAGDGSASTAALKSYSLGGVYNGATWDVLREVTNGLNSVGTGIPTSGQVGQCDDTSPVAVTENQFGNARINCATHAQFYERLPSASAVAGIAPVASTALETGRVLKAGAGNLYGVEVTTTSVAGYLQVFNLTAVPAAGAVTPVAHCYVAAFGTCALDFDPPLVMSVGISVAFSSATTPFTKTDSATAAFSGQVQ